jgi:lysophospholipase L1-like esterase
MVCVGRVPRARRTAGTFFFTAFFTALIVAFASGCSTSPTAPTDTSASAIVATVSQEPPPVPPRLDPLPPPPALGGTRFVAFGDSITYGTFSRFSDARFLEESPAHSYPARAQLSLRQTFPLQAAALTVINAGVPGESALDGRSRIQSVLTPRPHGLLLLEGINDMISLGRSPAATAAAVVAIVDVARSYNVTVLVGLMPQTYQSLYPGETEPRPQAADLIVPFNNELRRLTAGMQNVHIVDLYSQFGTDRSRGLMGADGLHPTEKGYELMAQTFVQAIETVFQVRGSLQ